MSKPPASQTTLLGSGFDEIDASIVEYVRSVDGLVSAGDIHEYLGRVGRGVSNATLARRMEQLIAERHVVREGRARATRYRWDPFHDYFSVPPNRRTKVGYKAEALADYVPNETNWLSPEERERLALAGGGRRLDASTYSRAIAQKLLVDLSYASSALEGNTYTYLDTQVLIEFGQVAEGKARDETVMILNHKEAITYLIDNIMDIQVSPREIKTFHALLSRGLSNMDPRDVGAIRSIPIDGIGGSAYVPLVLPQRIEEELEKIARKAIQIEDPHEQSLFLMTFISYLQAFRDVNKRTARLVCNVPLLQQGLAPLSFMDMDRADYVRGLLAFYELNRFDLIKDAYVDAYVKSAARYDAYVERPKEVVEIEFRRRNDIFDCVRAFVVSVGRGEAPGTPEEFALAHFNDDDAETRNLLAGRIAEIVESLSDGNHIAYGIPRDEFRAYEEHLAATNPKP